MVNDNNDQNILNYYCKISRHKKGIVSGRNDFNLS